MISSWRLKFHRAEEHFAELHDLIPFPEGRHPCPISETINANGEWEYAIAIPGELDRDRIAIVAGDLLFNIRSGLDHLLCALIPGEDKGRAQFPIFTEDPLETDKTTGKHLRPKDHAAWRRQTWGVPDPALTALARMQPYEQARQKSKPARHHSLAILNTLQNADKHRQLIFDRPGIWQTELTFNGTTECAVPGLKDGAGLGAFPEKVDVQAVGEIRVPFSAGYEVGGKGETIGYQYPTIPNRILDFIADTVLPALEPLVP